MIAAGHGLYGYLRRPFLLIGLLLLSLGATACTLVNPRTANSDNIESRSFQAQKGKLQWPSEGTIIEPYGTVVNPLHGTEQNNPGIFIATPGAAVVSSVYAGRVEDVFVMPEFGNVITISHGDYTTVYGNLSEMYVSRGMYVQAGEYIGYSGTTNEPKGESLFFALFDHGEEQNPQLWLRRR